MRTAPVPTFPLLAVLTAVAVAAGGCDTGFAPQYLVTDVRVLAVRTQVQGSAAADASPGDTVSLEALVANPRGRPGLTITWYGCAPIADESLPPCANPSFLADPELLAADPAVLRLGACQPPLGGGACGITVPLTGLPSLDEALDFVLDIAQQEPAFSCRPYAELPVVAVLEGAGAEQVALKRVRLVPTPEQLAARGLENVYVSNLNPIADDILRAGLDGDCSGAPAIEAGTFPMGETVLCASTIPPFQEFNVCGPTGERELVGEDLSWQWYSTGGEFPEFDGIGNATGGSVDFVRPAEPFTIWAILRDGRGGEDWLERIISAAP